nr:MAG TPA: hypothetical protein [Caudoviricetes sp.]
MFDRTENTSSAQKSSFIEYLFLSAFHKPH